MKSIDSYIEQHKLIIIAALLLLFSCVLLMFRNTGLIVDEHESYPQIINFTNGNFQLLEISAMPGYHALMAALVKVSGLNSVFAVRCITVIFGILAIFLFYAIGKRIQPNLGVLKILQFVLFPSVFLYFFMIYTDILSLVLVMCMFLFSLDKRYAIAGFFGILSMLVRQNNIIWTAFIPALIYYENFGFIFSWQNVISIVKKTWVLFCGFGLFVLFVFLNEGVALGDTSSHPAFKLSTGNLFFLLFCFFLFFLPLHIFNIRKIINHFLTNKWVIPISILLFGFYWLTFENDHPYNQIETHYFLRNLILTRFTASGIMKLLFFFPILFAFWSLVVTELSKKSHYLFYFFTVLYLLPSWLIEQRYYMIPFVFFMLFRKESNLWENVITVIFYSIILIWLMPLVVSIKAFL